MDKFVIVKTENGQSKYVSLNREGYLETEELNPLMLSNLMTKEQAFKVIAGLRVAAAGTEVKYRVKAASQALRDYCGYLITVMLPEKEVVENDLIEKVLEAWKPKVAESQPAAESEPKPEEVKPEKKNKKK